MIIGTAGHIDHGKSALVTALTGSAMDRLAEERRRGITIDLNFAPLRFEGVPPAGIVDVPGHEDFVRTMVAGASGIDLVLLVVDAAQGPQPQTWEHLAIVEQLGVPLGIPVITKADLADPEWLELVVAELNERLARSPVRFEAAAIVSSLTGQGIAELAARLRAHAAVVRERPDDAFRMPVDRAFSIAGVGTVVTGTPWSGSLHVGDSLNVLPSGLSGRVRSLEAYGAPVPLARPGERTAVGLVGIERAALRRGEVLVDGRLPWRTTTALDAVLELLPGAPPLQRRIRVRVHLGTAEVLARVYPREAIAPGGSGLGRLALESPVLARGSDRIVLRSYSPVTTIGGGRVVDPLPPRRPTWPSELASADGPTRMSALVTRRASGMPREELPQLLGEPVAGGKPPAHRDDIALVGGRYVAAATVALLRSEALLRVGAFHQKQAAEPGISLETLRSALRGPAAVIHAVIDAMIQEGVLKSREGTVALPGFTPHLAGGEELMERILTVLDQAGLEPPTVAELERQLGKPSLLPVLRHGALQRRLVAVESDRYFSKASLERFVSTIVEVAAKQAVTPAALRDRLGVSRKYLIPLLEWADRSGVTRRVGDARVLVRNPS